MNYRNRMPDRRKSILFEVYKANESGEKTDIRLRGITREDEEV